MKKIICFLFGHSAIKGLFETPELISDKGCKRCGAPLITSGTYWKGVKECPPPDNSNISVWHQFCENEQRRLRGLYYKPDDLGKKAIAYDHKQAGKIIKVEPHETETSANADYVTIDTGITLHRHYFWIEGGIFGELFEKHKKEFFK